MQTLLGQKKVQSQRFLENGKRIPVTLIDVKGNIIVSVKTQEKNNYQAVQLGFSMKKKATKAEVGHAKGAKLTKAPKFLKEVKIVDDSDSLPEIGSVLNPSEVFEPGDTVDVSGFSKGKGFQGGVKRHGFHGGPKTHGQSDRHIAPGSIGQGTTPGRVYKGKRMAGNMGNENVTIKNLEVIDLTDDGVLVVKGLVPGIMNGPLIVTKTGTDKNFVPLYSDKKEEIDSEVKEENQEKVEDLETKKDEADIKEQVVDTKDDKESDGSPEVKAEKTEEETKNESEGAQEEQKVEAKDAKEKAVDEGKDQAEAKEEVKEDAK